MFLQKVYPEIEKQISLWQQERLYDLEKKPELLLRDSYAVYSCL